MRDCHMCCGTGDGPVGFACFECDGSGLEREKVEMDEERMMKWFGFSHLPEHLQGVSSFFYDAACKVVASIDPGPERTVALRKLLEAKDAAVRAKLNPGC